MYGGRKSLLFVLLSVGAVGTLFWITAVYFRRKRRQTASISNIESLKTEEKPKGKSLRASGLLTRSQLKNKLGIKDGNGNNAARSVQFEGLRANETCDRTNIIADGMDADENSTSTEERVDRLIYQGMGMDKAKCGTSDNKGFWVLTCSPGVEEFGLALEHWYEAARHFLESSGQGMNRRRIEQEGTLRLMLNCSRKLRNALVVQGMAENASYAVVPKNVLSWIDDAIVAESNAELEERCTDDSDAESFVSAASETAALEFDDLIDEKFISESAQLKMFRQTILKAAGQHSHLDFYVLGLEQYARCDVECRKMRTEVVGCESDMEFLAKVVCIRQASELAFSKAENCTWMAETGRFMLSSVIDAMGKDPANFEAAFDELFEYCTKPENWEQIHEELIGRRVPVMSFYDVPLDFILLDAFDDLATPPYSVATAIQNRWLSASIKETALTTAIWGVLKAKASYLENQYGFMAHFYVVSQYILPCLAWGFMGPDEELRELCNFFKDQIIGYIRDVFSFDAADYSTLTGLSESIIQLAKQRSNTLTERLGQSLPTNELQVSV